jgi:hypothetical protein
LLVEKDNFHTLFFRLTKALFLVRLFQLFGVGYEMEFSEDVNTEPLRGMWALSEAKHFNVRFVQIAMEAEHG